MKTLLSSTDLIIECRDYRVPLSSRNSLFEDSLAGRERLIVYTKKDLGRIGSAQDGQREALLREHLKPNHVLFSSNKSASSIQSILNYARLHTDTRSALTGTRVMVVGMPNVGKSSLLNALRLRGVKRGKAATTGAQPGVTRKIGTGVKILDAVEDSNEEGAGRGAVYLLDTPGVFVPYVHESETMLKLAICGGVKDTIVQPETLADYLLFHFNLKDPALYRHYSAPTNDVSELLEGVAKATGRLRKGGAADTGASAIWLVQRWRQGLLGNFVLDDVSEDAFAQAKDMADIKSINQAKKAQKAARRERSLAKLAKAT